LFIRNYFKLSAADHVVSFILFRCVTFLHVLILLCTVTNTLFHAEQGSV